MRETGFCFSFPHINIIINLLAKVSLVGGALAWDVLIASCTANSNFISEFSETLRAPLPQAPRSSQMVQNLRILVQTRPPGLGEW